MEPRYLLIVPYVAVLVSIVLADNDLRIRIIGGHEVQNIKHIPYQVAIKFKDNHICGGSIIDKRNILTAANCALFNDIKNTKVWVGALKITENEGYRHTYNISHMFVHEDYWKNSKNISNDIAILRLSDDLKFNSNIQPIALANVTGRPNTTNCMISGWGRTKRNGITSQFLHAANVTYIERDICKRQIYKDGLKDGMICAGVYPEANRDACVGDDGGPLVCGKVLVGIISLRMGCSEYGYPGIYTEVGYYKNWIRRTLQSSSGTTTTASFAIVMLTAVFTLY